MRPDPGGWTGGQFSLARAALACGIAVSLQSVPVAAAALLFGAGVAARWSGAALAALSLARVAAGPWSGGLVLAGVFAALLALAPPAPWGSWARRGRVDPGTDWSLPRLVPIGMGLAAGAVLAADLAHGGSPLHPAHALLLAPGWIPGRAPGTLDRVFYDGSCALCHATMRFLIAEDRHGARFRYAPLESASLHEHLDECERAKLPDSIVVLTAAGRLIVRSDALLHLLERLGGWWRVLSGAAKLLPRPLRDALYDGIARSRYAIFGRKAEACPLLPPELRGRFEL